MRKRRPRTGAFLAIAGRVAHLPGSRRDPIEVGPIAVKGVGLVERGERFAREVARIPRAEAHHGEARRSWPPLEARHQHHGEIGRGRVELVGQLH